MDVDDIVVGAGHNGLAAAAYLARAGRRVLVLERADHVGGAAVSGAVFPGVDARLSRYSYLVSLLPRSVVEELDLDLDLVRRRVSSYTPVPADPGRGLLVDDGDPEATRAAFGRVAGGAAEADLAAWTELHRALTGLAEGVFPTLTEPLRTLDEVRDRVTGTGARELLDRLVAVPLGDLVERALTDDTLRGLVSTDGLIGTFAPLTGDSRRANTTFLYHVIGGGTGDWDVPVGGMGAVTEALARSATKAGARIVTGTEVTVVDPASGTVCWAGGEARARTVLAGCAPAVMDRLLAAAGADPVSDEPDVEGSQLKVNLVLRRLPRLRDPHVDPATAFTGTFHVNEGYEQIRRAYAAAAAGRVPDPLPCEVYCHTLSDRSILGPDLARTEAQTLTLFGIHTPARLFREDPEAARSQALDSALRSLDGVLGEPVEHLLLTDAEGRPCVEVRTPVDLERDLGLPAGNIFHRSLQWPWAEAEAEVGRWGVETDHDRLLVCGSGARRGGCVSGIPGHNAAAAVLERDG